MSQYFNAGDKMVWNSPGVLDGPLFATMAELLADQLGVPSGLSGMINDECDIDVAAFETFVNTILDRDYRTGSWFWHNLMPGYILTAWMLLERSGGTIREPNYDHEQFPERRRRWWAQWIERRDEAIESHWSSLPIE
ncbi:DUF6086 family protein [Nocardia pseudobrasiliensis]|uniref:Uncharacterized protein n=1 Tax=Nocardia pseudobrasiliensis TaxID=45979 RepID=A0A370I2K3_9NOCA|nr:DUF6086 family protein [Nocardia pseudobrasiliensis]RDI63524.1 hypothetical protein DFR76_110221 [Nocardia pseudobrasiliensis]